jgi:hypothetical protein
LADIFECLQPRIKVYSGVGKGESEGGEDSQTLDWESNKTKARKTLEPLINAEQFQANVKFITSSIGRTIFRQMYNMYS